MAFVGDGGFTMLMGEMLTAVKYKLPLVVVILRNDYLGQIRWEQMAFVGNPEFGVALNNPRSFADWATNCGALGVKVDEPDQLDAAFEAAFNKTDGPSLIECVVDPDEPPLPPITPAEEAVNFMRAMVKGQKRPLHIAVTMFRDKMDELLVQGMGKIPGPQRAKIEDVKAVRRGVDRRGSGAGQKTKQGKNGRGNGGRGKDGGRGGGTR